MGAFLGGLPLGWISLAGAVIVCGWLWVDGDRLAAERDAAQSETEVVAAERDSLQAAVVRQNAAVQRIAADCRARAEAGDAAAQRILDTPLPQAPTDPADLERWLHADH